ncbi:N-acetyltransferase [Micromonospora endophytica]|nr:N-acetyltransferase [Micromonospora endophytica]
MAADPATGLLARVARTRSPGTPQTAIVRQMRLERITPENYEAALALSVRPDQEDLVEPVVKSLAEAYVYPEHAWPRLIYDGDVLVGFLMAFLDIPWDPDRDPDDRRSGLWRLNIAADAQGRGYGSFAVDAVCQEIRARGGTRAYVTWEPRAGGPEPFYLKLGFRPTGEQSGGQTVGVLDLS